ncbi:hypothetical protein NUH16_011421 [Penicillium rubens]|uniref:Protein rds1 n=1 Tax=Penicillium chrysogenum TaxID=5076 RepID=A0ABQ8WAG7_PENCH|nr:uncharacterized protein N7525_011582 [Penicillium rubens]KAJ5257372.1 hypothetical protein N7524_008928 [Penicillium chrysogenum]KAJ5037820.1 hypothetical protein NUH16_011421 [Penicillium rubens]KAJ5260748.1 hypothetical protein N7505_009098 [Penicillium chrysogenum]KAJ5822298.1 hypothetical protein N7525_011582 [Penicillium rubens]KAJ5859937.1 hypothetical protein N7534_005214 [Penicillium rubens]
MKLTNIALTSAAIGLANAGLVSKRAVSDADILNYALTLEHLEASFYEEGLKNFTQEDFVKAGMKDPFYANLKEVASDEKEHVDFLTSALKAAGASPVARCTYNFPSADVNGFLALASVLEGVGVSAYLGAAASIMSENYLTAAGSILTTEARHSAYLRAAVGEVPFAQAFDNPLGLNEVYTVASPFIASCPSSNGALPVKAFPALTMSSMDAVMTGSEVQLVAGSGFDTSVSGIHAAFITVTGPVWTPLKSMGGGKFTVTIPEGISGQSYVVLTQGNKQATDDNIVAGPAIVEVGKKTAMGTPSGIAAIGMGDKKNITMPTKSTAGSWSRSSATASASASASPIYTGAAQKMSGNIACVVAGLCAAAALL